MRGDDEKRKRYSELATIAREEQTFVMRRIHPGTARIILLSIAAFLTLLVAAFNADLLSPSLLVTIVSSVFLILIAGTSLFMDRVYRLMIANEFQNALFAGAVNAESEFSIILRNNRRIVYFSPQFYRYFPTDSATPVTTFDDLLSRSTASNASRENLLYALKTEKNARVLCQFVLENNPVNLYLLLEPIPRPRGYFVLKAVREDFLHAGHRDINFLEDIEELLRHVLDEASGAAYIANAAGIVRYINPAFTSLLGFTAEDIRAHPLHLDTLVADTKRSHHLASRNIHSALTLRHRDGHTVKTELNQILIQDGLEENYLSVGMLAALTFQHTQLPAKADTTLLQSMWKQMMEQSPIGMASLDKDGRISYGNAAFFELVEKRESDTGWPLIELVKKEDMPKVRQLLEASREHGSASPVEIRIAGGDEVSVLLFVSRLDNSKEDKHTYLAYFTDITEQRNLEMRFTQAQKMQAVGQLAGGVAHDFNNLLTAMLGFCDLLLMRHPPGDPSFGDIMQVKQNANRAANLVRQLLAFSRKQTLQPELIDITDALADLSNLIRRLIGENITLKMRHGSNLGQVKVDHNQLEQVIINLAVNARDAMPDGGTITISTSTATIDAHQLLDAALIPPSPEEVITPGDYVRIDVADTGHGIPKHLIQQIFEPFFTTKAMGAGTGLGLSTVYGIIKQTGGYLYVVSEEGAGTTFSIFLQQHEAGEISTRPVTEEKISSPQDLTGAGTILLVEDEGPVRAFSARALTNKGYKVLQAESGEAALEQMARFGKEIDLIITDVIMPGMTGPAMAERIAKDYPDISVIFISGYAEDAFLHAYGEDRQFNFLPKPYTLKQLAMRVKEVMERRKEKQAVPVD